MSFQVKITHDILKNPSIRVSHSTQQSSMTTKSIQTAKSTTSHVSQSEKLRVGDSNGMSIRLTGLSDADFM